MNDVVFQHFPGWGLILLPAPFVLLLISAAVLRKAIQRQQADVEGRDWSVPSPVDSTGTSMFHRWDTRCKLASLLAYAFMVASLQNLEPALAAVAISLLALILARTPPVRAVFRLLAITGFVAMLLIVMPFSAAIRPGDTIIVFGGLESLGFNLRGLSVAATIAAKGTAIALLSEPLLGTAPLPVTLHGLNRLGAPEIIGQMVLLSHRYLHVFRHEAQRMAAGMRVRGFRKSTNLETIRAIANFLGMLFVRSFDRTERVFDAMQVRGYRGRFPDPEVPPMTTFDLLLGGAWVVLGVFLLGFDRLGT